jgi:hypothetical protein
MYRDVNVTSALMYRDVNVTSALSIGSKLRVCNDEWASFAAFNKVAVLSGSRLVASNLRESEAMGVLQLLRRLSEEDHPFDPASALNKSLLNCTKQQHQQLLCIWWENHYAGPGLLIYGNIQAAVEQSQRGCAKA